MIRSLYVRTADASRRIENANSAPTTPRSARTSSTASKAKPRAFGLRTPLLMHVPLDDDATTPYSCDHSQRHDHLQAHRDHRKRFGPGLGPGLAGGARAERDPDG